MSRRAWTRPPGRWTGQLRAIDPDTGQLPANPLLGFLPPNLNGVEGQGYVTYSVLPRAGFTTGTRIDAQARIVFDYNDPIDTPAIVNTFDTQGPTSAVQPLSAAVGEGFLVQWSGSDPGAGVRSYDVYVATDGGPFQLWLNNTRDTSARYGGTYGHSYAFFSIATDGVGHREPMKSAAEATTFTDPSLMYKVDAVTGSGTQVRVRFSRDADIQALIADGSITQAVTLASIAHGPVPLDAAQFTYDAASRTLTLSLEQPPSDGYYQLRLDGSRLMTTDGVLLLGGGSGTLFEIGAFDAAQNVQAGGADIQAAAASVPALGDFDQDGVTDLIVGEQMPDGVHGQVRLYHNSGTNAAPVYDGFVYAQTPTGVLSVPASGCLGVFPRLYDWNRDGKSDLVLGLADGTVQVWTNVGTPEDPRFDQPASLVFGPSGAETELNVGARATLAIVDWNDDGRDDLLVGGLDGKVRLYLNDADTGPPHFSAEQLLQDGGRDLEVVSGRASVAVADLDGDGRKDLIVGNTDGQLFVYRNQGTDASPVFDGSEAILADGQPIQLSGSVRTRPFVGDYNADGVPDLLVGALDGLVRFYNGHAPANAPGRIDGNVGEHFTHTFAANAAPNTTSVSVASADHPAGSVYGEAVTFVATVTAATGTPTGSVQFLVDGQNMGAAVPLTNGSASFIVATWPAGSHTVAASFTSDDSTAFPDSQTETPLPFEVARATLTITADNQTKVYGAALPNLTLYYSGFVNGDTAASLATPAMVTTTATAQSHVGDYPITVAAATSPNYTISFVSGHLFVTPAPLTITADNQTKAYGAALPNLTLHYSGFVNGDTAASLATPATVTTTATPQSHVGDYPITVAAATSPNYTISFVSGHLFVTPAPLTITADNQTKVYGAVLPNPTLHYSGFVNGDTAASLATPATVTTTATAQSHVGNYSITAAGATSPDYTMTFVPGTLRVTPALLTIRADNQTKVYGAALPNLTVRYSGFVNGDTAASLTTPPRITTTATAQSHVGSSTITVAGARSPDYSMTFIPGTLRVTPALLTIKADDKVMIQGGALPALTATYTGFVNGDGPGSLRSPASANDRFDVEFRGGLHDHGGLGRVVRLHDHVPARHTHGHAQGRDAADCVWILGLGQSVLPDPHGPPGHALADGVWAWMWRR